MSNGSVEGKSPLTVQPGELRLILQALRSDILQDVDTKLLKGIDRLVMELELKYRKPQNGLAEKPPSPKGTGSPKELPPKEFVVRNSTLTNLWDNAHLRSVYNICLSLFVLLYLNVTVFYFLNVQKLKKDLAMVFWTFGQFHIVTAIWFAINLSIVFLLYPAFRFWATTRLFVKQKGVYDFLFCALFILYETAFLVIPARIIIVYDLPPVSSFTVLAEQSRLFMKTYAFVRENITRALNYKPHQDGDKEDSVSGPCPEVEKLIYFLFAPTLVYRDNYPRTAHIRWSYVAWNFLQVFCCIIGAYIPVTYFIVDTFNKIGSETIPLVNFMGTLAMSIFAGGILMFLVFYGMFHCWLNAFSEMLRFGDRMFYDDWWNCTSFAKYYRSWNMVVYDWLYSYIYRDMYVARSPHHSYSQGYQDPKEQHALGNNIDTLLEARSPHHSHSQVHLDPKEQHGPGTPAYTEILPQYQQQPRNRTTYNVPNYSSLETPNVIETVEDPQTQPTVSSLNMNESFFSPNVTPTHFRDFLVYNPNLLGQSSYPVNVTDFCVDSTSQVNYSTSGGDLSSILWNQNFASLGVDYSTDINNWNHSFE